MKRSSADRAASDFLRIGLTGPIGCGKSTIGDALRQRGGAVINADDLVRDATAPGSANLDAIRARFGDAVFATDGSLDRPVLAAVVFSDPAALRDLEAIMHPAVRPFIERSVKAAESAGAPFVLIEAIKLVEAGYGGYCDEVWLVTCSPEEQRRRLAGRGFAVDDVERRMASQGGDLVERLRPHVTRVIDAGGSLSETMERANDALDAAFRSRGSEPP